MPRQRKNKKKALALRGKGDYSTVITSMPPGTQRLEAKIDHLEKSLVRTTPTIKNAAATVGRTLGNFVNQGDLGALAGQSLAKLFGHGDYTVKSNTLMGSGKSGPTLPKFDRDGKRGTRIVEREYLGEVRAASTLTSSATTFQNTSYSLLPTNSTTFPWLSTIAQQFDQWEPHGIVFEFVSTSSSYNGSSQALGTVIMATDYDILDVPYGSKQSMENSDYACSTRPAENLLHGIECDPSERPVKVMYTGSNQTTLSTLGNFQLATVGCSSINVTLGELWVSYDITFYKKQLVDPISFRPYLYCNGSIGSGVGYFSAPSVLSFNEITLTQNVGVGSVINFPPNQTEGFYLFWTYSLSTTNDITYNTFNCAVDSARGVSSVTENTRCMVVRISGPLATITTGLTTSTKVYRTVISPIASTFVL